MNREIDWESVIFGVGFGLGFLILGTIILIVVIRQFGESRRAKMLVAREEAYRQLAERYDALQAEAAATQRQTLDELRALNQRTSSIETLLRSVE